VMRVRHGVLFHGDPARSARAQTGSNRQPRRRARASLRFSYRGRVRSRQNLRTRKPSRSLLALEAGPSRDAVDNGFKNLSELVVRTGARCGRADHVWLRIEAPEPGGASNRGRLERWGVFRKRRSSGEWRSSGKRWDRCNSNRRRRLGRGGARARLPDPVHSCEMRDRSLSR
jgi:hypothetical protein